VELHIGGRRDDANRAASNRASGQGDARQRLGVGMFSGRCSLDIATPVSSWPSVAIRPDVEAGAIASLPHGNGVATGIDRNLWAGGLIRPQVAGFDLRGRVSIADLPARTDTARLSAFVEGVAL